jgi:hypothetical protein
MVVCKLIRRIGRKSCFLVLGSIAGIQFGAEMANAQFGSTSAPIGGSAPGFNLTDIPLAEGETIVNTTIDGKTVNLGGQTYSTVEASSVPTLADPFGNGAPIGGLTEPYVTGEDAPMLGDPSVLGDCATGSCGNCGRCGGGHTRGLRSATNLGGRPRLGAGGNVCGPTCSPYQYVIADALYMRHDGADHPGYPVAYGFDNFDFELGMRLTIGTTPDCHNGYEMSFVGPFQWSTDLLVPAPPAGLFANMIPIFPFTPDDLSSFNNAAQYYQFLEADYWSLEMNRTMIGWDVIKLLYGFRYIDYQEDYLLLSQPKAPVTGIGQMGSSTNNRLFGGQVGLDLTYPVTCRLWSDMRARGGIFANLAENTFSLGNEGVLIAYNDDSTTKAAWMFELGGGMRYYLTNNFHLRAGSEIWYLDNVATAMSQFGREMSPSTGQSTRARDNLFMFGFNVGAEWKF